MTRRTLLLAGWVASLTVSAVSLRGQMPEDLARPKAFRAFRVASTDPHYRNGDFLLHRTGGHAGTGPNRRARPDHGDFGSRSQARRPIIYANWCCGSIGTAPPARSVECPLGDFYGQGFGRYVEFHNAAVSIGGVKALNCYWPMPFAKEVRLTMTNEGSKPVHSCYFNIDYRLDDQPAAEMPLLPHP